MRKSNDTRPYRLKGQFTNWPLVTGTWARRAERYEDGFLFFNRADYLRTIDLLALHVKICELSPTIISEVL